MESGRKMSLVLFSVLFVIAACTGVATDNAGSHSEQALLLEANPQYISLITITDQLNLTCRIGSSGEDIYLEIRKDSYIIATIDKYEGVRGDGDGHFQVEGNILDQSKDFFLRAMIQNPGETNTGTYSCTSFVDNQQLDTVETTVQWLDDQNVTSAIKYLMDKVSRLETELSVQRIDHSTQLATQTNQLKQELEQQKNESKVKEAQLQAHISELECQASDHEQYLRQINDTASFTTAFSVEHPTKSVHAPGETILFTNFIMNVGDNYNMDTGVYRAPRKGLYVFHMLMSGLPRTSVMLVGSSQPWVGRVLISRSGSSGTVCDDGWDDSDARVICRMLGYSGGKAVTKAGYGQGTGRIWLDDVKCVGNEVDVFLCPHSGWGVHNCRHNEDAGVQCQPNKNVCPIYEGYIHLMVNNKTVKSTFTLNQPPWGSDSIRAVISLNPGDQVKPVTGIESKLNIYHQYRSFDGYLLRLI